MLKYAAKQGYISQSSAWILEYFVYFYSRSTCTLDPIPLCNLSEFDWLTYLFLIA